MARISPFQTTTSAVHAAQRFVPKVPTREQVLSVLDFLGQFYQIYSPMAPKNTFMFEKNSDVKVTIALAQVPPSPPGIHS